MMLSIVESISDVHLKCYCMTWLQTLPNGWIYQRTTDTSLKQLHRHSPMFDSVVCFMDTMSNVQSIRDSNGSTINIYQHAALCIYKAQHTGMPINFRLCAVALLTFVFQSGATVIVFTESHRRVSRTWKHFFLITGIALIFSCKLFRLNMVDMVSTKQMTAISFAMLVGDLRNSDGACSMQTFMYVLDALKATLTPFLYLGSMLFLDNSPDCVELLYNVFALEFLMELDASLCVHFRSGTDRGHLSDFLFHVVFNEDLTSSATLKDRLAVPLVVQCACTTLLLMCIVLVGCVVVLPQFAHAYGSYIVLAIIVCVCLSVCVHYAYAHHEAQRAVYQRRVGSSGSILMLSMSQREHIESELMEWKHARTVSSTR